MTTPFFSSPGCCYNLCPPSKVLPLHGARFSSTFGRPGQWFLVRERPWLYGEGGSVLLLHHGLLPRVHHQPGM